MRQHRQQTFSLTSKAYVSRGALKTFDIQETWKRTRHDLPQYSFLNYILIQGSTKKIAYCQP